MKQIFAILSKNANYVYHMLSVAKVGYDNDYGNKYMNIHSKEDLKVLNQLKYFITVQGGEHCGELYWLISQPAGLVDEISLEEYYSSVMHLFTTHNIMENKEKYYDLYNSMYNIDIDSNIDSLIDFHNRFISFSAEICEISNVMRENYCIYIKKVWNEEKQLLQNIVNIVNSILKDKDYISLWETATRNSYSYSRFYVVICNSISNGPEAIDITNNKDIFAIPNDFTHFRQFVSHELGIYILKENLGEQLKIYPILKYYSIFESLAGFYNELILKEKIICWSGEQKYKDFYRDIYNINPQISPKDLFIKAINKFYN